jgi:large subunit ribosomal protein L6
MSNIGKQSILIPPDVRLKRAGWILIISGIYGSSYVVLPRNCRTSFRLNRLRLICPTLSPNLYGSLQRKIQRIIDDLWIESVVNVQLVGANYRARIENNILILRLGYSHEINVKIPANLNISITKRIHIRIVGKSSEDTRQYAYKLRSFRPPEPFKGKGVVCVGEVVRRKEGKKKKI